MRTKVLLTFILGCILYSCGCGGSNKNSEQQTVCGAYRVDLTVAQSGVMTTIIIKPDGSATMQQDGYDVEYCSWSIGADEKSVELDTGGIYSYWMDFPFGIISSGYIYYGIDDYKSKNPNRRYKFTKIR